MNHPMDYYGRIFIINLPSRTGTHDLCWYDTAPLVRDGVARFRVVKNALKRR